jgi:hypothetical protein
LGEQVWVARGLAAVASALSAGILYLSIVAAASGRRAAVFGALCLAAAQFVVLYGRFAYTYNLLALWTALTLLWVVLWRCERRVGFMWLAGGAATLGLLTDQEGIFLPLFVALALWPNWRRTVAVGVAACLPAAVYAAAMVALSPQTALADWRYSILRLSGAGTGSPAGAAIAVARWIVNELHLLRAEWWIPLGAAGTFCIRPQGARRTVLALLGLAALPIFALRELDPFFRTGVPLLVPLCWGMGALLDRGLDAIFATVEPARRIGAPGVRWRGVLVAVSVVGLPLGLEIGRSVGATVAGFHSRFDWALVADQESARAAAAYVNSKTTASDVVLVSPAVAWQYHALTADFFQAIARDGEAIAFYPAGMPPERFRFDPSTGSARYAVVDGFWDVWAGQNGHVAALMAEVERWPLEWRSGAVRVHHHP